MRVTVIGLGKLGSVIAAVLAEKGFTVVGVDTNEACVTAVNEGRACVTEPGLDGLMRKTRNGFQPPQISGPLSAPPKLPSLWSPRRRRGTASFRFGMCCRRLNRSAPLFAIRPGSISSWYRARCFREPWRTHSASAGGDIGEEMRTGLRSLLQSRFHSVRHSGPGP